MSSQAVPRNFPKRFDPGDLSSMNFIWERGRTHLNHFSLVASYRAVVSVETRDWAR